MEQRTKDLDTRQLEATHRETKFHSMYADADAKVKDAEERMRLVKDAESRIIEREASLKCREESLEKQRLAYSESEAAWRANEREREDSLEERLTDKVRFVLVFKFVFVGFLFGV